ncbi:MAG TPA: DNA-3-methyladenine glycosylase I [Acetobacteraceae bacterium]|nr:DNA-3-methyladenine glycosylase I [Acetobacteraceae bacterium]
MSRTSPASHAALPRCPWAAGSPEMLAYHDQEWGTPQHDDRALFELITLEGAQAGLSWRTILARRKDYRLSFHDFDIARVAAMTDRELEALIRHSGIIRNRLKIYSVRSNAEAALAAITAHGSLDSYLWSFVGGTPIVNHRREMKEVPASTALSDSMSKALRKAGFRFVGSTICYAFLQASGMVDDHLASCFRARTAARPS